MRIFRPWPRNLLLKGVRRTDGRTELQNAKYYVPSHSFEKAGSNTEFCAFRGYFCQNIKVSFHQFLSFALLEQ